MKGKPGTSWGPEYPVNLMRSSRGWLAVDYSNRLPVIVKVFKPKSTLDVTFMMDELTLLNYGTLELDPEVREEMDNVS